MENTNYKVLLVEDDKLDQMAFERFVESEKLPYSFVIRSSISEAKSVLENEQFDIIITDFTLGDGTALDILEIVKDVPIILTTGARDEEVAVKAWKAGAYDYLAKDYSRDYLKALPKTIVNAIKRRQMEVALDRKQRNLVAIFDTVPIGLILVCENFTVSRVNDAIRQMFNRDYSQMIGRLVGDAIGCVNPLDGTKKCGDTPDCSGCLFRKTIQGVLDSDQSVYGLEIRPKLEINQYETSACYRISAKPVMIDGDRHVIVAIDDVTQWKKIEHERLLAEEKYRMIFENSAVAITLVNEHERLVSWNKYMEGLLGFHGEELRLKPIRSLYPWKEWEKIRTYDVRQKGMQHHLETKMLKKDGSIIDVDISLSVLKDSHGKTTGSIGIIRDITERKQAEEKLKETMELKSQFISTVSHEIRTPLAALKEGVSIILDGIVGEINEQQRKFLDIAKRNVDRLSALINDVLDFQKLGAGKMNFDMQYNDVVQVINEVYETMILFAQKNKVKLICELSENLPEVKCDRAKIIQVVTNLIGNAIKFTPAEGKVIIKTRPYNDELALSVIDTGMGIPKEELTKIFDRFYRVKRKGQEIQGTGLGLAIVNKIVMAHKGRIDVESQVDKGTTFTVYLPLHSKDLPETAPEQTDKVLESTLVK